MRLHGRYIIQISVLGFMLIDYVCSKKYTNTWAFYIEGGEKVARDLAKKHGFIYVDKIMPDYYTLQHRKVAKRSVHPSSYHHRTIAQEPNVRWLEQQVVKKRVKRDIYYHYEFNDPKWPKMWYLLRGSGLNMNVRSAWEQGMTGRDVVVTILDDGIERNHSDLEANYDPDASYDVNNHDKDPMPRYDFTNENRHGTRCAGEVAAQADNNFCNVGVAYHAKIGGVRMLDGDVTDSVEAQSLSLNFNHIHIYSASWGPDDDGRTVDGPATLARKAFYDGITKGRGGLGSIFVWASGNGGRDGDSCNCDGYTNSIYTLSISSATEYGNIPWYSEACSSTLATTYSSGSGGEKQIVTTDLRNSCTVNHTGTSASAPLAAGICALALQANPSLTWRDMQHIVVMTARKANLEAADWVTNGVGRKVSHSFGFGLMDAGAMVRQAKNWTRVPDQHICEIRSPDHNKHIAMNGKILVPLFTDGCEGTLNHVKYLEHVQARITLTASRRGEIRIFLTSPMGTRSTLLARRVKDTSREGFNNWAFMTTHSWGEYAKGRWILEIENGPSSSELKEWTLSVMGTAKHPQSQNLSQPLSSKQPFKCPGFTSEGICYECRPGFYSHKQRCVASCPDYYYATMETVTIDSKNNTSSKKPVYQLHGTCLACNVACKTCKGPDLEHCFQCNKGYELRDSFCRKKLIMNFLDPDMLSFFVWVIILCTSAILLFGVIFIVLQARDHRILCWKEKRHFDETKGKYNGVKSLKEGGELEGDHLNVVVRNVHYRPDDNEFIINRPLPPPPISHPRMYRT